MSNAFAFVGMLMMFLSEYTSERYSWGWMFMFGIMAVFYAWKVCRP